jgi:hypothetical protein
VTLAVMGFTLVALLVSSFYVFIVVYGGNCGLDFYEKAFIVVSILQCIGQDVICVVMTNLEDLVRVFNSTKYTQ